MVVRGLLKAILFNLHDAASYPDAVTYYYLHTQNMNKCK